MVTPQNFTYGLKIKLQLFKKQILPAETTVTKRFHIKGLYRKNKY